MEMWEKIGWALLLGMMLAFIFPRARQMLLHSPKGSTQDWIAALIPIAAVALFIILLVNLV